MPDMSTILPIGNTKQNHMLQLQTWEALHIVYWVNKFQGPKQMDWSELLKENTFSVIYPSLNLIVYLGSAYYP